MKRLRTGEIQKIQQVIRAVEMEIGTYIGKICDGGKLRHAVKLDRRTEEVNNYGQG